MGTIPIAKSILEGTFDPRPGLDPWHPSISNGPAFGELLGIDEALATGPTDGPLLGEADEAVEGDGNGPLLSEAYEAVEGDVNIATEVSMLSSFISCPREGHLNALFHIYAYLKTHDRSRLSPCFGSDSTRCTYNETEP